MRQVRSKQAKVGWEQMVKFVRSRGLQRPFSREQLAVMVIYPCATLGFVALALCGLPRARLAEVLGPVCGSALVACGGWATCSCLDPRVEGGVRCPCLKKTQQANRPKWCAVCNKSVPGLDHHCVWMNTCVGQRTYPAFYALATAGLAQFGAQSSFGARMLSSWEGELASGAALRALLWLHAALAGLLALAFCALWCFHTHLLLVGWYTGEGIGTFDWLIMRHEREMARQEQQARQERRQPCAARSTTPQAAATPAAAAQAQVPAQSAAAQPAIELAQLEFAVAVEGTAERSPAGKGVVAAEGRGRGEDQDQVL